MIDTGLSFGRIVADLEYSVRSFVRTPGLAFSLLLTIALGIGSNVSIRGFVEGLTQPVFPPGSLERVVIVFPADPERGTGPVPYDEYLWMKSHLEGFEWLGAARVSQGAATVAEVTPELAGLFRVQFENGRGDDRSPSWLGGVFRDQPVEQWLPFPTTVSGRENRNIWVIGRLRSEGSVPALARVLPYTGVTPERSAATARIATLLGLVAFAVLFIACANVATFLLGRALTRSHETSLRVTLGATRGQLARVLLTDSIVISLAGGAGSVVLAIWTAHIVPALLFQEEAERLVFASDLMGVIGAASACAVVTIVCGLLPVFAITQNRPGAVLRRESAGPSRSVQLLRSGLVVFQMAGACVLVVVTAVLYTSLHSALQTTGGNRLGEPILATVQAHPDVGGEYFRRVEQATRTLPGITGLSWAGTLPGGQPAWRHFHIEPQGLSLRNVTLNQAWFTTGTLKLLTLPPVSGRMFGAGDTTCRVAIVNPQAASLLFDRNTAGRIVEDPEGRRVEIVGVVAMRQASPEIYYYGGQPGPARAARFRTPIASELPPADLNVNIVSEGYFEAMGLSVVASQPAHGCRTGMVNEEAAGLYFGGKAIGAAVIDSNGQRTEIIGVVHAPPIGTFQPRVDPAIYFGMEQDYLPRMTLILSARDANDVLLAKVRHVIESVPGRGPAPIVVRTLQTHLSQTSLASLHIATVIIGASTLIALALSAFSLFSALGDAARQRRRELAIRITLGATRWHVILQVLKVGARLACYGIAAGTVGSILLSRLLAGITQSSSSPALWVWLAAPLALSAAVAFASVVPARRSLMVDPLTTLRDDN